jgi:hypothetical protein
MQGEHGRDESGVDSFRIRSESELCAYGEEFLISSLLGWLVADGWCWFVLREEYCWLVAAGCWWLVRSERKVLLAGG